MFVFGFVQGLGCSHRSRPIVEGYSDAECADACKKGGGIAIIFQYHLSYRFHHWPTMFDDDQ